MNHLGNAKKNLLGTKNEENKYYDEKIKINIQDKNDSHAILANLVKENSLCLDIGCSVGYIGELLKKEKNCTLYGIEIDKEAIKMAEKKKCYEKIYTFSITDKNSRDYQNFFSNNIKFDYILFADILEHLEEPYDVIYNLSKKLKENGKLLISLPNIAHMDISKNLIDRKFNYNLTGLLDNTHLRFFTKNSFIDMIHNINERYNTNLQITKILNTTVVPSYASSYPNLYKILNQDNELCTLQYIFEITISPSTKSKINSKEIHYYDEIEKNISERNAFWEKIKEQEREILKSKKEIAQKENEINNLNNSLDITKNNLNITKKSLNTCQEEMTRILNSKSWKITKPLRAITNRLSKK